MSTSGHVFVLKQVNQSVVGYLSNVGLAQFCKNPQHCARKDLMRLTAGVQEECTTVNGST